MAPRPYWKGYLKLSLVSCPIALYPAIDASERVSFRQVNKKTGNRLRQQLVDFVTGEVVEAEDKGRGYEVGENQFLVVEEEELEKARTRPYSAAPTAQEEAPPIARRGAPKVEAKRSRPEPKILAPPRPRIENTRTIEIERFVPRGQIDARYHHTPYYIGPRDLVGQEAFAVIRYALSAKRAVGMGRVVLSNRERPIMLEPMGLGLRGITLRYTHQIRSEAEYFGDIPEMSLPKEMLRIAEHIVGIETLQFHLVDAQREERYDAASRKTCGAFAEERDRTRWQYSRRACRSSSRPSSPDVDDKGNLRVPSDYRTTYQMLGSWAVAKDDGPSSKEMHMVYASPGTTVGRFPGNKLWGDGWGWSWFDATNP